MRFGDFLNTMASKMGLQNDPNVISILSNATLSQSDIADDLANRLNAGLFSLDGAKSSPEVKKHFDALALKAVDEKLNPLAQLYNAQTEFEAEKSTYKRIDILSSKIAAHIKAIQDGAAKGDVTKDAEVKRLNGELVKLQQQLTQATTAKDLEISNLKTLHQKAMLDSMVDFALTGKNYANKQLDSKTNVLIARSLLTQKLQEKGAVIINDNGTLKIKNATSPELDLLDEGNKPVTFAGFTDKVLADAKLLEVSAPPAPQHQQPIVFQNTQQQQQNMEGYNNAIQDALSGIGVQQGV